MKKLLLLCAVSVLSLSLTACGDKTQTDTTISTGTNLETTQENTPSVKDVADLWTYHFTLNMTTTYQGQTMNVNMDISQKENNSLFVINKFDGLDQMGIAPKKILVIDNATYTNLGINGEDVWFQSAAGQDSANDAIKQMFDLKEIQKQLASVSSDVKGETINGRKMQCYYLNDSPEGKAKTCLENGIFAYGEVLDPTGTQIITEVTDFSTKVDQGQFVAPKDIKTEEEINKMMSEVLLKSQNIPVQ